jgi:hypothetical protein
VELNVEGGEKTIKRPKFQTASPLDTAEAKLLAGFGTWLVPRD